MNQLAERKLFMPHEVARFLSVSVAWVYNHSAPSAKNPLPVKRVGNLLRYDLEEVLEWVENKGATNG